LKDFKEKIMRIKFTCASVGELAQTIRTNQFEGFNFKKGQYYTIYFTNGTSVNAYVNRQDGSTLYIKGEDFPSNLKKATVGNPVSRIIKSIKKNK